MAAGVDGPGGRTATAGRVTAVERIAVAVAMGLRELRHTPVVLALLVFLPAYIIGAFVWLVSDDPVPLTIDGAETTAGMSAFAAAFMTPVAVAILTGIVGLFLMHSSRAADGRLRLSGLSATELVVARVGLLAVGTVVATAASLAVALAAFTPESVGAFAAATFLVGLTYGVLGVTVGLVLDRLAGVYVMLFAPMVDVLMFQNPLATDSPAWTALLPGHFATDALVAAAFTSDVATGDFLGAVGYVLVVFAVGVGVFYRATAVE